MVLMAIGLVLPAALVHVPATTVAVGRRGQRKSEAVRMLPAAGAVLRASARGRAHAAALPTQDPTGGPRAPAPAASNGPAGIPVTKYTVQPGDTLSGIAARFGTDLPSLEASNHLNGNSVLQPGQHLTVPTRVGWVFRVATGDTLGQIAADAGVSAATIASANHIDVNAYLQIGQRLWIPHDPPAGATQGPAVASDGGSSGYGAHVGTGSLPWPVHGPITSPWGWRILYGKPNFHHGIDIGVPMYTPVHASISGTVITAGWDGGYGIAIRIQNGNVITLYAHNSSAVVRVGQHVQVGQLISYSGMTGNATGPHVHFAIFINGTPVNPIGYLQP